jgi:ABC-type multidrug transport system fused ATPase/permease subunit
MHYLTPIGIVIEQWPIWWADKGIQVLITLAFIIVWALLLRHLDNTPKAKARRAKEIPTETRAKIAELSQEVLEGIKRERVLREELAKRDGLLKEIANHNRNANADIQALR